MDKTHNAAVCDHCRLQNIDITVNAERYPAVVFNAFITQNRVARVFKEAADIRKKLYNMVTLLSNSGVNTDTSDFTGL